MLHNTFMQQCRTVNATAAVKNALICTQTNGTEIQQQSRCVNGDVKMGKKALEL